MAFSQNASNRRRQSRGSSECRGAEQGEINLVDEAEKARFAEADLHGKLRTNKQSVFPILRTFGNTRPGGIGLFSLGVLERIGEI